MDGQTLTSLMVQWSLVTVVRCRPVLRFNNKNNTEVPGHRGQTLPGLMVGWSHRSDADGPWSDTDAALALCDLPPAAPRDKGRSLQTWTETDQNMIAGTVRGWETEFMK